MSIEEALHAVRLHVEGEVVLYNGLRDQQLTPISVADSEYGGNLLCRGRDGQMRSFRLVTVDYFSAA